MDRIRNLLLGKEHVSLLQRVKEMSAQRGYDDGEESVGGFVLLETPDEAPHGEVTVLDEQVAFDLELFQEYNHGMQASVVSGIDRCSTRGGSRHLRMLLSTPLMRVETLHRRQRVLRAVSRRCGNDAQLAAERSTLRAHEADMRWLLTQDPSDPGAIDGLIQLVTFSSWLTRLLNRSPLAIGTYNWYRSVVCPTLHIGLPILYVVLPYLALRLLLKVPCSVVQYLRVLWMAAGSTAQLLGRGVLFRLGSLVLSVLLYVQGALSSLDVSAMVRYVSKFVTSRLVGCVRFCHAAQSLLHKYWGEPELPKVWFRHASLSALPFCRTRLPSEESMRCCIGQCLHTFLHMDRSMLRHALSAVFMTDCVVGLALLRAESGMCDAQYQSSGGPTHCSLRLRGVSHPCLDRGRAVRNDLLLGTGGDAPHSGLIITGPNAGGKSTLVKSVGLAVLMAQTLTICSAVSCRLCPFAFIATHINVPDAKGRASLFEAQLGHVKRLLDKARATSEAGCPSLIVADELFNSTNSREGEAAAFAVAKQLGRLPGCVTLITTHYAGLSHSLATECADRWGAVRMDAELGPDGRVKHFPYLMTPGTSQQQIALELAQSKGFPHDLLTDAIKFRDNK
jgi:hypothetical protein